MKKSKVKRTLNINSVKHLSYHLGFPPSEILQVASGAENLYNFKEAPKKSGGVREISIPRKRLKRIQTSIHTLLAKIAMPDCAHGGIKGRSNLTNAQPHCNKRFLLNLDLKNFYPSISHYMVYALFHKTLKCSSEVSSILTKLTTVKGQVPQGGSMSTDIANLVLRELDKRIGKLSTLYGITYTRYVDDISLSGNFIPDIFIRKIKQIVLQTGFQLKTEKEALRGPSEPKYVTGLSVNRKKPNVPRLTRREVRKEAYLFNRFPEKNLEDFLFTKKYQQIKGKLAYIDYIKQNGGH
ncbi:RNA-directed DNA polymerase (Retron-type reverse transcriptase) [uncultured Desulfobacterium sp.]|uniref:RNA-directed DNA polymerase n=1 Tax=uncultured Desulfobacterium sp. TaxID=201089 RepID=A0A445MXS3_9BACT|nr:RNA-directed DNA polymerase (Retron-type reverse transcriptase) [uncultured Desulfobacterium sp.]